ncbi:T9SS type A sorting domain-containing protein [Dyadobacter psychrotolerans]|nr:T9SS type A sorting domain-containing protein [Dyadobacter psychrotolerans]
MDSVPLSTSSPMGAKPRHQLIQIKRIIKGLVFFCAWLLVVVANAQIKKIAGPAGSESFGLAVTVLTNGNYVVTDPLHDIPGITNVGAVHLYNGITHALISTITGSGPSDQAGSGGITALTNGNFVISSPQWRNGGSTQAGAATWGNGVTGISGVISIANSLVGSTPNDNVSSLGIRALPNGHYVVVSPHWEHNVLLMNDAGAVTWGNGTTGTAGLVSESNSIVGSRWDDAVGSEGITILTNNNYVVTSTKWGGSTPLTSLGAVTWCNGSGGSAGRVSLTNSLLGSLDGDNIGSSGVKALPNGNYVVCSPSSRQGGVAEAGAVTWGNGATGTSGLVDESNSLVGSHAQDQVGYTVTGGVVVLTNGNYIVDSENWDNGSIVNAGAVTWCNGVTGRTGVVTEMNSLVGSTDEDKVGGGSGEGKVVALTNGNYVVSAPFWDNGAAMNTGAVIWCDGNIGSSGTVNPATAIIGAQANDQIARGGVTPLSNGHYVISSPFWDNAAVPDVGATTWANGTMTTAGTVSISNSIIGSSTNDFLTQRIAVLTNGHYVISNRYWNNGAIIDAGAATWRNGNVATNGVISADNSLTGSTSSDNVGQDIVPLRNGNYVVGSRNWNKGAISDAGAVTWGDGATGITGLVSEANSLVGSSTSDQIGVQATAGLDVGIHALANGNYLVESHLWNNGGVVDAGAVTLADGTKADTGIIDASNSLVGSTANDNLGYYFTSPLTDGNYLVRGVNWDNGLNVNVGSMTLGNGSYAVTGVVNPCNSVIGSDANEGPSLKPVYNYPKAYLIVGTPQENAINIFKPTGQELIMTASDVNVNITGVNQVPILATGGCYILASITPNGSDPVSGKVHTQVWIEGTVPSTPTYPFVARHYQITPEKSISTARVTLYFTNKDFLEFNSHPGSMLNLPANGGDAVGISNLRVEKFAGKSDDGTGLPATYHEGSMTINPDDSDIVWDNYSNRWEVSFDVSKGFSGFIVHTNSEALPVRLVSLTGEAREQNAFLQWKIADPKNFYRFEVERSTDAKKFQRLNKIAFSPGTDQYDFVDKGAADFTNAQSQLYYRLKMLDLDGSYAYSRIITLKFNNLYTTYVYPNPFSNEFSIIAPNKNIADVEIQFIDSKGRLVMTKKGATADSKIHVTNLKMPPGAYTISVKTKAGIVILKGVKQD